RGPLRGRLAHEPARRHAIREPVHRLRPLPPGRARAGARGGTRAAPRGTRAERAAGRRVGLKRRQFHAAPLAVAAGAALRPALAAEPAPPWPDILARARGQTVFWNAWAGAEQTNAFIAWVGEQVRREHGVEVRHVRLKDTAEAVTRVIAEKAAGRDADGSVD